MILVLENKILWRNNMKRMNIKIIIIIIFLLISLKIFFDHYNIISGNKIKNEISLFYYVFIDKESTIDLNNITPKIKLLNLFHKKRHFFYKNDKYYLNFWIDSKTGEVISCGIKKTLNSRIHVDDILNEVFKNEKLKNRLENQYQTPPKIEEDNYGFNYEFIRKKDGLLIYDNIYN